MEHEVSKADEQRINKALMPEKNKVEKAGMTKTTKQNSLPK